jgi:hypothetical protein
MEQDPLLGEVSGTCDLYYQQLSITVKYHSLFQPRTEEERFLIFPAVRVEFNLDSIPQAFRDSRPISTILYDFIQEHNCQDLFKYPQTRPEIILEVLSRRYSDQLIAIMA